MSDVELREAMMFDITEKVRVAVDTWLLWEKSGGVVCGDAAAADSN